MKGKRFLPLVALAAMSLVACGGPKPESKQSEEPPVSSEQPSSTAPSSSKSSAAPESKSETPAPHVHNFQEVAAENGDDYKVMKCAEDDAKYLMKKVADVVEGTTKLGEDEKFGKGQSLKYSFTLKKNYKVNFQFGFKLSSSSHEDRKFQTDSTNASSNDPFESNAANDGTQRYWLLVNGERVEVTNTKTYGENGMNTEEFVEVVLIDSIELKAGANTLELCSHASTGYRLYVGGEVRLGVLEESEPAPQKEQIANGDEAASVAAPGKMIYWNDQNWCGSTITVPTHEIDKDGEKDVYHASYKTEAGACVWAFQLFYTDAAAVAGKKYEVSYKLEVSKAVDNTGKTGEDYLFHTAYADGDQLPSLKQGVNKMKYVVIQEEGKATLSLQFSAANASATEEFDIKLYDLKIAEYVPPHVHDLEAVAHEQGEGEVAMTIKKCKEDTYYEASWSATDAAATSQGWSKGKLGAVGDYVEFKVWVPEAMTARLYANGKYNKSNIKDVAAEEKNYHHSVWYDWRSDHDGFKVKVTANGTEIDQSKQSVLIDDEEISLKDLNFPDLNYKADSNEVLEMPWVEIELVQGVNTIKLERLHGYGHTYETFVLKGEAEAATGPVAKPVNLVAGQAVRGEFEDGEFYCEQGFWGVACNGQFCSGPNETGETPIEAQETASGGKSLGYFNKTSKVTLKVNSPKAGNVNLVLCGASAADFDLGAANVKLTINGVDLDLTGKAITGGGEGVYNAWATVDLGAVAFAQGENVVVLEILADQGPNLDYMDFTLAA